MTEVKNKPKKAKGPEVDDLIFGNMFDLKDIKQSEPRTRKTRTTRNVSLKTTPRPTRTAEKDPIESLSRAALEKKYRDLLVEKMSLTEDLAEAKRLYRRCQILVDNFDKAITKYKKTPLS